MVNGCLFLLTAGFHRSLPFSLQFSYESLFRSTHFALMDNACREYLFMVEFFNLTPNTAQDFFDSIFGRTLAYLLVGPTMAWSCCELHSLLFSRNKWRATWTAAMMLLGYSCVSTSTIATRPS